MNEKLQIDKDALDNEFVDLPELMQDACDAAAEAVALRDAAEETLKVVDAELDKEIRIEGMAGKGKLTEAMVEAAIQTHPRHEASFRAYNEAKLAAAKAIGHQQSVKTKEKSLEQLASLYLSAYWVRNSSRSTKHEETQYNMHRAHLAQARRVRTPLE